jgi:DNA-binding SARP family transcriptional activator
VIRFGVLGPVVAEDARGRPVALKGPMHRAVLARLLVARGRVVPVTDLVDDLWVSPPAGAVPAVRTFVAALRKAIEPDRPARAPASLLVTQGLGYALRCAPDRVDAWRFERAVTGAGPSGPAATLARLDEALAWWRGPAYADFPDAAWSRADRSRLAELRLHAVEQLAEARLGLDRAADAIPDLDEHVTAHPWREQGWRLLALAFYRTGRQADALAVLRCGRWRPAFCGRIPTWAGPAGRTRPTRC